MADLLLVTTACQSDLGLARKRLEHMKGLGAPVKRLPLLLINDGSISSQDFSAFASEHVASNLFSTVSTRKILDQSTQSEWPYNVNHAWRTTAKIVSGEYGEPFDGSSFIGWFYFEPDVTLLHKDFGAILEAQYLAQPVRQFMGAVSVTTASNRSTIRHMNGAGVYPISSQYYNIRMMLVDGIPWDVAGLGEEASARRKDIPQEAYALGFGTTAYKRDGQHFTATQTLHDGNSRPYEFELREQILHHGCKDGSLMDLLAEKVELKKPEPPAKDGLKSGSKILSSKEVKEKIDLIKSDRDAGMPWKELMKKHRMSPASLSLILKS